MDGSSSDFYSEIRMLARSLMRSERKNHTLSPTDLFHEAYCRVGLHMSKGGERLDDLRSLFAVTMRRVLIDHARKRNRRDKKLHLNSFGIENMVCSTGDESDRFEEDRLSRIERALQKFEVVSPEHAKLVTLKYFGGLTIEACAQAMGVSEASVQRSWRYSKAWLMLEIERLEQGGE
ncbi:MAG: sigma-70 family RNA polymerase sigma factor [Pirellula sp.]